MAAAYEPPVSDAQGELVIRPSWKAVGRWAKRVVGLVMSLVLFGGLGLLAQYRTLEPALELVAIGALILALYGLYLVAYVTSTGITVTADAILVRHGLRSTARVAASDIARVVRISVVGGQKSVVPRPAVFAFSASGRCVLSLYAERWSMDDLDRIWRYLRVTPEGSWERTIGEGDLLVEFPGAFQGLPQRPGT